MRTRTVLAIATLLVGAGCKHNPAHDNVDLGSPGWGYPDFGAPGSANPDLGSSGSHDLGGHDGGSTDIDSGRSSVTVDRSTGIVADGQDKVVVTVSVRDGNDAPVSDTSVALTASGKDESDTISSYMATDKHGVATFVLVSKIAETRILSAKVRGTVTLAQQPAVQFIAGPPAELGFRAMPAAVQFGQTITPAVQVEVQDKMGNRVHGATNVIAIRMGCCGVLSGAQPLAAVDGVATFAGLSVDRVENNDYLWADANGLLSGRGPDFNVTAGPPTKLAFYGTSNVGLGEAMPAFTVALQDAAGNADYSNGVKITLALGASDVGTLDGSLSSTTINGSATFVGVSIPDKAGTHTLVAKAAGYLDGTTTFTVFAGPAASASLAASPTTLTADGNSSTTLTVSVADAHNNPVAGQSVTLRATGMGNHWSSTTGTTTVDGQFTAALSSTVPEAKTVTVTVTDAIDASTTVTFDNVGAHVDASPASVPADGNIATTLTVTVVDDKGKPAAGQTVAMAATGSNNSFSLQSGTTNRSGQFTTTLKSTTVETKTITATVNGAVQATTKVDFIDFVVCGVSASPAQPTAGTPTTLTATLTHHDGSPVVGATVSFDADGSDDQFDPPSKSGTTTDQGTVQVTLKSTKAEFKRVTAKTVGAMGTTVVTFQPDVVAKVTATVFANPVPAGHQAGFVLSTTDQYGNPVPNTALTLVATGGLVPWPSQLTTDAQGGSVATLNAGGRIGTYTLKVLDSAGDRAQADVSFVAGAPYAATSTLTSSSYALLANGGTSTITLTVKDAFGNAIAGQPFTLHVVDGPGTLATSSDVTGGDGSFSTTFTAGAAATVRVVANVDILTLSTDNIIVQ
jgi:hypothetical protein